MRTLKRRKATFEKSDPVDFIGSGCTWLNCALSGRGTRGGWARARIANIVGDRSSGKTVLALEACFRYFQTIKKYESKIWPKVKRFDIVYNNAESVMDFDINTMYGERFNKKVNWIRSPNVEHFGRDYARRVDQLTSGHALLYVVDTLDFLKSKKSIDRFQDSIDDDAEVKGTYDTEKQRFLSNFFAHTSEYLLQNEKDATLIIISQVRKKIGQIFGKQDMRTGGKAFDHAIHQEAWIRQIKRLPMTRKGERRIYGIETAVKIEKNKCAKPFREANFKIIFDYGVDNLASMIDYLYGNKQIKFDGKTFKTHKTFIKYIEQNNYEKILEEKVEIKWANIETAFVKEVEVRKKRW